MSYPLPGMNPWLENPIIWRGVHQRLIVTLGDRLTSLLAPRYFVDVETGGHLTRGMTVVDQRVRAAQDPTADVAVEVAVTDFVSQVKEALAWWARLEV